MKKTKLIILGSGDSFGIPRINGDWGRADNNNPKNQRMRCSLFIKYLNISIIIDTSPDIKKQLLQNNIKKINAVIYTHDHADQVHGINELRYFYYKLKKKIPIYGNIKTINSIKKRFNYLFKKKGHMYNPIFKEKIIKNKFLIKQDSNFIKFNSIKINHGETPTFGFIFNDIAYLSDCKSIPSNSLKKLLKLKLLIIDCLKFKKHPTHLNYNECMEIIQKIKPKKTILTNLHSDLDYKKLRVKLKKNFPNIFPAYDGMKIII